MGTREVNQLRCRAAEASELLKAMSNAHRLEILCHLVRGERSVSQLTALTSLSQSSVSQHLARLREMDLVAFRRDGQNLYYGLNGPKPAAVMQTLHGLFCRTPAGVADLRERTAA